MLYVNRQCNTVFGNAIYNYNETNNREFDEVTTKEKYAWHCVMMLGNAIWKSKMQKTLNNAKCRSMRHYAIICWSIEYNARSSMFYNTILCWTTQYAARQCDTTLYQTNWNWASTRLPPLHCWTTFLRIVTLKPTLPFVVWQFTLHMI